MKMLVLKFKFVAGTFCVCGCVWREQLDKLFMSIWQVRLAIQCLVGYLTEVDPSSQIIIVCVCLHAWAYSEEKLMITTPLSASRHAKWTYNLATSGQLSCCSQSTLFRVQRPAWKLNELLLLLWPLFRKKRVFFSRRIQRLLVGDFKGLTASLAQQLAQLTLKRRQVFMLLYSRALTN